MPLVQGKFVMQSHRRPPNSVVFTGYYGMKNFGDDIFAAVCVEGARKYWGVNQISLLSPEINGVRARFLGPPKILQTHQSKPGLAGRVARLVALLQHLNSPDMIMLGGGSVLSVGAWGTRDVLALAARAGRLRVGAIGVSVGPFVDERAAISVQRFLAQCAYVSVRDRASYEIAIDLVSSERCRLVAGVDLAGQFGELYGLPGPTGSGGQTISLALCHYESLVGGDVALDEMRLDAITSAVARIAKSRSMSVRVFSLNEHDLFGDRRLAFETLSKLEKLGVPCELVTYGAYGLFGTWEALADSACVVSVRLHGAIASYLSGVPIILAEYHKKCSDFLDDIGQAVALRIGTGNNQEELERAISTALDGSWAPRISPERYSEMSRKIFLSAPWLDDVVG